MPSIHAKMDQLLSKNWTAAVMITRQNYQCWDCVFKIKYSTTVVLAILCTTLENE